MQARYLRRGRAPAVAYEKAARAAYGARDFAALKEVGQDARVDGAGSKELTALLKEVAESGKSASGRAELRVLKEGGCIGQMQISAELVPIPECCLNAA